MMHSDPLLQILILLTASVCVVAGVRKLKLPAILGYLAVGMLLGPHAFALAQNSETTQLLADFGVVFLVFTLGLEFSLPRLVAMRWEVLGVGGAQVLFTTAIVAVSLAVIFDVVPAVAVVIGGAVAMSSTAIIISQLTEQSENNRTHGRLAVAICLFQDLSFPLFLALVSVLTGSGGGADAKHIGGAIGIAVLALLLVLAAGRWLLRPLFLAIASVRSAELFSLAVLLAVLASAWATHAVGLSLALGAFLAGMMLAETEFRHQIEATIRSYREVLLGLFFITVGMLLDVGLLLRHFALVVGDSRRHVAAQGGGGHRGHEAGNQELVQIAAHGSGGEPGRRVRFRAADFSIAARATRSRRGAVTVGCHRIEHGPVAPADPAQSAHHAGALLGESGTAAQRKPCAKPRPPSRSPSAITW
jgi:CPA2 family monovalent cation:H+ antiporter-2